MIGIFVIMKIFNYSSSHVKATSFYWFIKFVCINKTVWSILGWRGRCGESESSEFWHGRRSGSITIPQWVISFAHPQAEIRKQPGKFTFLKAALSYNCLKLLPFKQLYQFFKLPCKNKVVIFCLFLILTFKYAVHS